MHTFLRSIGFSNIPDRQAEEALKREICRSCDSRTAVRLENGSAFVEYSKEFAPGCGVTVCGIMDTTGFHMDYYFPYYREEMESSSAELEVEKHASSDSFAGICEDNRMGTSLIFYVLNAAEYQREAFGRNLRGESTSVSFTALATDGRILLPVLKNPQQDLLDREAASTRCRLIAEAKNGDETAIESLTMEDIDTYNMVSRRLLTEDVFSIVDTFFMPSGMECDHYQIMGEIQSIKRVKNVRTKEYLYQMKLLCNDLPLNVCINEADLLGDPMVGRRFKGDIWLQGNINFK